jgi:DNA helicase-2/ATP-dependent DNA helicase PcrA
MGKLVEMPRSPEPLPGLNREQQQAVEHGEGPLLVVAGAGTGKTRVITQRIASLLDRHPDMPGKAILGLTYTDKSAAEMHQRVVNAVGARGKDVWVSTFHAFCLHRIIYEVNPGAVVLENEDSWIVLRRNLPRLQLQYFRSTADPGRFLGDFHEFFTRCQDELVTPDDFDAYTAKLEQTLRQQQAKLNPGELAARQKELLRTREIARAYRVSQEIFRKANFCTYGMMLLDAVQELRRNSALRDRLRQEYRYILVDEFQDTNYAQIELLSLLAEQHRNIVAVGDNDQGIYRFRGASFSSFTLFLERFASIRPEPGHLGKHFLALSENYRSSERILRVAGAVIAQNEKSSYLPEKRLRSQQPGGERVQVVTLATAEEEAFWVARELATLHDKGQPWNRFAVLYRVHSNRDHLVKELDAREIPYVIRNLSILAQPLIRDLVAYLQVIATPWNDVACARVLAIPAWGLQPADLVRLAERTSSRKGIHLWDALEAAQGELPFSGGQNRIPALLGMITALRKRAKRVDATELLDELTGEVGLVLVRDEAWRKYLDAFRQFVREWQYKAITQTCGLREFVEYLAWFEEAGGAITLPEKYLEDAVQLITVHSAKGLEFDHVFVIRAVNGAFPPRARKREFEFPADLMKEELPQGDFHIQEERRLFYVALTRAREKLTLTTLSGKRNKPSPFLDDFLQEPLIQAQDVQQLAPSVVLPEKEKVAAIMAERRARTAQRSLFDPVQQEPKVGSRIAVWSREYRPPVFSPLVLSASAIDTYQACPLKYLYDKSWHIRGGASAAFTFGNTMHTVIKHFLEEHRNGGKPQWDDLERIYEREWNNAGFEDQYQEDEYKHDGREQLRAFFATFLQDPPKVKFLERFFELPVDRDVQLRGRIDQVTDLGEGQDDIVDYKTGRPKDEAALKKSLAMSIYALAAREALGLNPARISFYSLTNNEVVSGARSEKQLKEARDAIALVAENIRAGAFDPKPNFATCRACDYRPICPEHENS